MCLFFPVIQRVAGRRASQLAAAVNPCPSSGWGALSSPSHLCLLCAAFVRLHVSIMHASFVFPERQKSRCDAEYNCWWYNRKTTWLTCRNSNTEFSFFHSFRPSFLSWPSCHLTEHVIRMFEMMTSLQFSAHFWTQTVKCVKWWFILNPDFCKFISAAD